LTASDLVMNRPSTESRYTVFLFSLLDIDFLVAAKYWIS
jgi:hypothetical protein